MGYKDKPIIKLFKFTTQLEQLAIIDDYEEVTIEHNKYNAGEFSIQINFNIPNSQLFDKNLIVQIGDNEEDIFVITSISDEIGEDGKQSQVRTVEGYDLRYLFKRRIIGSLNNGANWEMTGKAENVMLALISDQCGANAETKRKLPINVEASKNRGGDCTVSESYTNLYEVLETVATQGEIGWKVIKDSNALKLKFYTGTDLHESVFFSTKMDSLKTGNFSDSLENYTNAVYVGGKGNNDDKDIFLGETKIKGQSPSGLDRFEIWDNQSSMTNDEEYSNEATAKLTQYGQTVNIDGQGLIQCPYVFREQYNVGDIINLSFNDKSANVQILSVVEHWSWNSYELEFSFGKPVINLKKQLQLILKKLHTAEAEIKSNSTDSVRYYTIPNELQMEKGEVTYGTIGFTGNIGDTNKTFKLYYETNGTGAKTYHVYFKNIAGNGKLILSSGVAGKTTLEFTSGTYVAIIYVDNEGNVKVGASLSDTTVSPSSSWSSEKTQNELNSKADAASVPTKTSQLINNSGFISESQELRLNYYTLILPQNVTNSYAIYSVYGDRKISDYDFLSFYVGIISDGLFYPRGFIKIPQELFKSTGNNNIYRVDVPTMHDGQYVSFRYQNDTSIAISAFGVTSIGVRVFGEIITKR